MGRKIDSEELKEALVYLMKRGGVEDWDDPIFTAAEFLELVDEIPTSNGWISANFCLPGDFEIVLVAVEHKEGLCPYVSFRGPGGWAGLPEMVVTHWHRIPSLPKIRLRTGGW